MTFSSCPRLSLSKSDRGPLPAAVVGGSVYDFGWLNPILEVRTNEGVAPS
jgi:hypothetical protein